MFCLKYIDLDGGVIHTKTTLFKDIAMRTETTRQCGLNSTKINVWKFKSCSGVQVGGG